MSKRFEDYWIWYQFPVHENPEFEDLEKLVGTTISQWSYTLLDHLIDERSQDYFEKIFIRSFWKFVESNPVLLIPSWRNADVLFNIVQVSFIMSFLREEYISVVRIMENERNGCEHHFSLFVWRCLLQRPVKWSNLNKTPVYWIGPQASMQSYSDWRKFRRKMQGIWNIKIRFYQIQMQTL